LINGDVSRPLTQVERTRRSVQPGVWADGQTEPTRRCSATALVELQRLIAAFLCFIIRYETSHRACASVFSFRSAVAMTSLHRRKWRRKSARDVVMATLFQLLALATALSDLPNAEPMPADFTGKSFR